MVQMCIQLIANFFLVHGLIVLDSIPIIVSREVTIETCLHNTFEHRGV